MYQHVRLQMPVDKQKQRLGVSIYEKFRQITYLWLMLEYGHKSHLKHFSPSWVFLWTFKVYLSGNDFPHILQCRALSDVCNFCMCNLKSVLRPHVVGHWKKNVSKFVTMLISRNFCLLLTNSHWKTGLSPVWIKRWAFKLLDWVNRAWQMSHSYGFSPVWMRKWRFSLKVSGLAYVQCEHW